MLTEGPEGQGPLVVGLGGTLRSNSSTERALRQCLAAVERQGGRTKLYCVAINSADQIWDEAGELSDVTVANQLELLASQLLTFARSGPGQVAR
jgi:hypothetical protein